jgi:hypothetical protein
MWWIVRCLMWCTDCWCWGAWCYAMMHWLLMLRALWCLDVWGAGFIAWCFGVMRNDVRLWRGEVCYLGAGLVTWCCCVICYEGSYVEGRDVRLRCLKMKVFYVRVLFILTIEPTKRYLLFVQKLMTISANVLQRGANPDVTRCEPWCYEVWFEVRCHDLWCARSMAWCQMLWFMMCYVWCDELVMCGAMCDVMRCDAMCDVMRCDAMCDVMRCDVMRCDAMSLLCKVVAMMLWAWVYDALCDVMRWCVVVSVMYYIAVVCEQFSLQQPRKE